MAGALEGFRVLDLTAMISGPFATMILADQGADVIKVEPPGIGDPGRHVGARMGGISAVFASCNRGKRSIVIDLKSEAGLDLVRELAATSDVFIQNYRPGVIERIGLDEPTLRRDHPELVYVSINAFGETGPHAERPAFDPILQGLVGAAYVQHATQPQLMRHSWCDKATALLTAQGITSALLARERGADGQHLHVSMLDAALSFLWPDGLEELTLADADRDRLPPPLADAFKPIETSDGLVTVTAVGEDQMNRLLIALGEEALLTDPRFATAAARNQNLGEWRALTTQPRKHLTTAELLARLEAADVPCGPVLDRKDVLAAPQVAGADRVVEIEHPAMGRVRQPRPPVRFESTREGRPSSIPTLGEHTTEILADLGRSRDEVDDLRARGAIG